MRSLLNSVKLTNLVQSVDTGRETTVKAEHLVFDNSSQWQVIEELSELLPNVSVTVLPQALVIESVTI